MFVVDTVFVKSRIGDQRLRPVACVPDFGPSFEQSTPGQIILPLFGQANLDRPSISDWVKRNSHRLLFGSNPWSSDQSCLGQPQPQAVAPGQRLGQMPGSTFGTPHQHQQMFQSPQLSSQMAPVAPIMIPLPDREVQASIDAFKEEAGNPKYGFKHLLLSVTDPSARIKPPGVSDIMWAEAMNKLEGMENADRERLWPEAVYGFKDLSNRMKLQDDAIAHDAQRLQATEANVKVLHRHFDVDTLPWIQRLRQRDQELQRRLLKVMQFVEALEGKGFGMALTRGETKLGEQLRSLTQQLQGAAAKIPRRVDGLLSRSCMQAGLGQGSAIVLGPGQIDEHGLSTMQEVVRQQTQSICHLTEVLKRDIRDMEIIVSENVEMNLGVDLIPRRSIQSVNVSKFCSPFRKHSNRLF